jgi:hypothetical protein
MTFEDLSHLFHSVKYSDDPKAMETLKELIGALGNLSVVAYDLPRLSADHSLSEVSRVIDLSDFVEIVEITDLCASAERILL